MKVLCTSMIYLHGLPLSDSHTDKGVLQFRGDKHFKHWWLGRHIVPVKCLQNKIYSSYTTLFYLQCRCMYFLSSILLYIMSHQIKIYFWKITLKIYHQFPPQILIFKNQFMYLHLNFITEIPLIDIGNSFEKRT